jgi:amidophosphoribosyltransferase
MALPIPSDKFREECGVMGVYGHPEAAKLVYLGLYALQHRGQESAGIVATDGDAMRPHKGMGQVSEIFTAPVLSTLTGPLAIGHTRYSTAGATALVNAQPLVVDCNKGLLALAHNGNLVNAAGIRQRLERRGSIFQTTSDTEVVLHLIAESRSRSVPDALAEALRQLEGAYSIVMLTRDRVIAARDPRGFRPLCIGRLDGAVVFASETCAFDLLGAAYEGEVEPGEMIIAEGGGVKRIQFTEALQRRQCVFEHVYFSRPDSVVFGRAVHASRERMGRLLAREAPADADVVVPVPDSGTAAALGFASESGIPLKFGLIRNHYIGRTFIEPKQSIRDFGVKLKLNPVRDLLEGQRVVLVDDSIVRGTTSRKIVRMIREAGAAAVHMRISCPPTISPCFYGVDTPTERELIAADHTVEEIREYIDADSLAYLSLEGLREAVQDSDDRFCNACYTGKYPTLVNLELEAGFAKRGG